MNSPEPLISRERWEVFANGLDHPECLAFDRDGDLWAGGEAGQIYCIDRNGKVQQVADLGGFVGGVALSLQDELFACCPSRGIVRVKRDGKWEIFAAEAIGERIICPNFGLFNSRGDYYVTDSGQWMKQNGWLLRFDHHGKGERIAGPFGYANGLALSHDEKSLFMVESDFDRVWRFELDNAGNVKEQKIFCEGVGRMPDGVVLDKAGNLYASCYASDEIWKITPEGKKELFAWDRWAILLSQPTNMAFDPLEPEMMYVANLGRTTITRARVGVRGQPLANWKK
ncbi:MAG TPA: SMP-30/gluconolactonase/LRE family protein [Tepidisphaeraceae bacterium]|jgi:gluconolactonase